jgi:hypothetical protein
MDITENLRAMHVDFSSLKFVGGKCRMSPTELVTQKRGSIWVMFSRCEPYFIINKKMNGNMYI